MILFFSPLFFVFLFPSNIYLSAEKVKQEVVGSCVIAQYSIMCSELRTFVICVPSHLTSDVSIFLLCFFPSLALRTIEFGVPSLSCNHNSPALLSILSRLSENLFLLGSLFLCVLWSRCGWHSLVWSKREWLASCCRKRKHHCKEARVLCSSFFFLPKKKKRWCFFKAKVCFLRRNV